MAGLALRALTPCANRLSSFNLLPCSLQRYHNIIWHNQMPSWLCSSYQYPNSTRHCVATNYSRAEFQQCFDQRVNVTAAWYGSRPGVYTVDVVNEALNDTDGELWQDVYRTVLGDDYIDRAFRLAKATAPSTITTYNDYWLEGTHPRKTAAALALLASLLSNGTPIDAVGFQMHYGLGPGDLPNATGPTTPTAQERIAEASRPGATTVRGDATYKRVRYPGLPALTQTMAAFASLGLQIQITELDISITGAQPADNISAILEEQARIYAEIVQVCLAQPACTVLGTWGFTDKYTWLGSKAQPLPFDTLYQPKPAFNAMVEAFTGAQVVPSRTAAGHESASPWPTWTAPFPQPDLPYAGYTPLPGVVHTEIYHAVPELWTYNHAAMLDYQPNAQPSGRILVTWKNGVCCEDKPGQRIMFSQSDDGVHWTPVDGTNIMFPNMSTSETSVALFAAPPVVINGHMYAAASPIQFCLYPDQYQTELLLRRVYEDRAGHLGQIFWASNEIPPGLELASALNNVTTLSLMDAQTKADVALLTGPPSIYGQNGWMPCNEGGATGKCEACAGGCQDWRTVPPETANERSHYTVPPSDSKVGSPDVLLYRYANNIPHNNTLWASVRQGPGQPWSALQATNIPNQPSNLNTGSLPDGRRYLLINLGANVTHRDPLVVATTRDGWAWDSAASVVSCHDLPAGHCTARYPNSGKDSTSVAYPQGLAITDPAALDYLRAFWVVYTNNKEDVFISRVPFSSL